MPTFHLNSIKENYPYSDAGELFIIPTIRRCSEFVNKANKVYSLSLNRIENKKPDSMKINLSWQGLPPIPPKTAMEENTVTEHAALGIAHIIFPQIINKTIERTKHCEGADYWIGDKETLLEVSGMHYDKEKIESRLIKKERQLCKSPFYDGTMDNVDGYVSVTHFEQKISALKYIPKKDK